MTWCDITRPRPCTRLRKLQESAMRILGEGFQNTAPSVRRVILSGSKGQVELQQDDTHECDPAEKIARYRISWPRGAYLTTLPLPISEPLWKKTSWLSSGYRHGLAIATLFLEPFRAHARGLGLSLDHFKLYIPNLKHSLAVGQFEQTVSRGDPSSPIPDLWKRA